MPHARVAIEPVDLCPSCGHGAAAAKLRATTAGVTGCGRTTDHDARSRGDRQDCTKSVGDGRRTPARCIVARGRWVSLCRESAASSATEHEWGATPTLGRLVSGIVIRHGRGRAIFRRSAVRLEGAGWIGLRQERLGSERLGSERLRQERLRQEWLRSKWLGSKWLGSERLRQEWLGAGRCRWWKPGRLDLRSIRWRKVRRGD